MKTMWKRTVCALLAVACALSFAGCGGKKITIASKQYTENILLSEMLAQLIEAKTDIKVERKQNLGGTSVVFPGMQKGEIDIYVEYTGTANGEILKNTGPVGTPDEVYDRVKKAFAEQYDITWFDPIGINNTYALGVTRAFAQEKQLAKCSDLAPLSPELRFGANHVFYSRESDGYDATVNTYGFKFKESLKLDSSVLYDAIVSGDLDVMIVYATDAKLKELDLIALEDDKHVYPPYYGAPICRNDTLKAHPELSEVLNSLAGQIDDVTMQELNFKVEGDKRSVEDVAKEFLQSKGLIG